MRLFIAIPLGEAAEAELKRLIARLRPAAPDLRWSAPEDWHITLQFLGTTSEEQCACLLPRLSGLNRAPIAIDFEGLGVFDRAGVFFLGVRRSPALEELQSRVVAATGFCGFEPEERPFRPHITLARSKAGDRNRALRGLLERAGSDYRFARFSATEFRLYESFLSQSGSRYEVRGRFSMGEARLQD